MEQPDWVPPEVDIAVPSIARVYDYLLGGSHNFAADREAARRALSMSPAGRKPAWDLRGFLRRAVEFLVAEGIDQFLDIGSGIPTAGNVHEIAQRADPDAHVVYVDIDPIAVAHSRALLRNNHRATAIHADIRDPERILAHPDTRRLLDFDRPVALLTCAVWHFVPDADNPTALMRKYRDTLAAGSYLALSHATTDHQPSMERFRRSKATYDNLIAAATMRSKDQVRDLFDGFDLVEPGLVWVSDWRPDADAEPTELLTSYGCVGRKP